MKCDTLFGVRVAAIFILISVTLIGVMEVWKRASNEDDYIYEVLEMFEEAPVKPKSKVGIALLMRKPVDLPVWLKHHRDLGISHFYIRLEDTPGWEDYLESQDDVTLEVAASDKEGNNYETLMYRQKDFVNKSLKDAREDEIEWLFHIDSDELLHGSLTVLDDLDAKYKAIRIQNAEAIFRENEDTCFSAVKFLKCGANAPCRSYVNGKGGGRVMDGVQLAGPHHFSYKGKIHGDAVYETPFEKLHVLHFDSCSFGAWAEKFQHLSKEKKDNIPFPYYKESVDVAVEAYNVYKKHSMPKLDDLSSDLIYEIK